MAGFVQGACAEFATLVAVEGTLVVWVIDPEELVEEVAEEEEEEEDEVELDVVEEVSSVVSGLHEYRKFKNRYLGKLKKKRLMKLKKSLLLFLDCMGMENSKRYLKKR